MQNVIFIFNEIFLYIITSLLILLKTDSGTEAGMTIRTQCCMNLNSVMPGILRVSRYSARGTSMTCFFTDEA